MPKKDSQLYNQVKNSEVFERWVAENYDKIKNNQEHKESIEFPRAKYGDKRALFATIHNADMKNSKVNEDGSFTTRLSDGYDFDRLEHIHSKDINDAIDVLLYNQVVDANNRALSQQEKEQIKKYLLSTEINLSKEELEEILRKYKKK